MAKCNNTVGNLPPCKNYMEEITQKEYLKIYSCYKDRLVLYATYTDSTGHGYHWSTGTPESMTEWGLKETDKKIVRMEGKIIDGVDVYKYYKFNN